MVEEDEGRRWNIMPLFIYLILYKSCNILSQLISNFGSNTEYIYDHWPWLKGQGNNIKRGCSLVGWLLGDTVVARSLLTWSSPLYPEITFIPFVLRLNVREGLLLLATSFYILYLCGAARVWNMIYGKKIRGYFYWIKDKLCVLEQIY